MHRNYNIIISFERRVCQLRIEMSLPCVNERLAETAVCVRSYGVQRVHERNPEALGPIASVRACDIVY